MTICGRTRAVAVGTGRLEDFATGMASVNESLYATPTGSV